jgi:hypothetical protein
LDSVSAISSELAAREEVHVTKALGRRHRGELHGVSLHTEPLGALKSPP